MIHTGTVHTLTFSARRPDQARTHHAILPNHLSQLLLRLHRGPWLPKMPNHRHEESHTVPMQVLQIVWLVSFDSWLESACTMCLYLLVALFLCTYTYYWLSCFAHVYYFGFGTMCLCILLAFLLYPCIYFWLSYWLPVYHGFVLQDTFGFDLWLWNHVLVYAFKYLYMYSLSNRIYSWLCCSCTFMTTCKPRMWAHILCEYYVQKSTHQTQSQPHSQTSTRHMYTQLWLEKKHVYRKHNIKRGRRERGAKCLRQHISQPSRCQRCSELVRAKRSQRKPRDDASSWGMLRFPACVYVCIYVCLKTCRCLSAGNAHRLSLLKSVAGFLCVWLYFETALYQGMFVHLAQPHFHVQHR